jgi:GNAT superfamily N-acetyltransferase
VNLKLRTVSGREEARALLPLLEQALRETSLAWGERPTAGLAERYLERTLRRREAQLVVAEDMEAGRPVGVAGSAPFEDPLSGEVRAMLVLLYVEPPLRQRGVARALVRELRAALAERGIGNLLARAGHNDDALISMGERWGFVRTWELMSSE